MYFGENAEIDLVLVKAEKGLLKFCQDESLHCPICGNENVAWYIGTSYYFCSECDIDFFRE